MRRAMAAVAGLAGLSVSMPVAGLVATAYVLAERVEAERVEGAERAEAERVEGAARVDASRSAVATGPEAGA